MPWPFLLALSLVVVVVWWIYPFFDLKRNTQFNSDSAMVLTAITEHVPLSENIFQWGGTRTGLALGAVGWIFFRFFGAVHLTSFLGLVDALLFVIGCSVFVRPRFGGRKHLFAIPAGLLLVVANFNKPLTSASFTFTATDIAHRPEGICLMVFLSWFLLGLAEHKLKYNAHWWLRAALVLCLSLVAVWVTDLALVAGLVIVLIAMGRAVILKLRLPWEGLAILLCSAGVLKLLRKLSAYGGDINYLYQLPERELFRAWWPAALRNLWNNLSPATWCVIALVAIGLAVVLVAAKQQRCELIQDRAFWHTVNLFLIGVAGLIVPLGSKWVFLNEVHPRYFAPAAILLCVAAAQGGAFLFQHWSGLRPRPILVGGLAALLFVPLILTGRETARERRQILNSPLSSPYQASVTLAGTGVRGILGAFWESYVYVLARPGFLKAAPTEIVARISVPNTLQVLALPRVAWIDRNPANLKPVMNLRGLSYRELDKSAPVVLPTTAYFKLYARDASLRIQFGQPEYRIYLRQGWWGDESDESHSWTWAVGKRAILEVPLRSDSTYLMKVVAAAAPGLDGRQEMTVSDDGHSVGRLQFDTDGRLQQELLIPSRRENRGTRQIEFQFAYAKSPSSDHLASTESRALAVLFEQAVFTEQR